jgi:hypothetical protein
MGNRKDYHENEPATQGQEEVRDSKHAPPPSQKGPQVHAEGQHGSKTHSRFIEQLHEGEHRESREDRAQHDRDLAAKKGGRRLVEDRQQHDEAEKNSEREQLSKERRHGRDDGPSDNRGSLHGVLGHREHRADYKMRGPDGLPIKE